MPLQYLNYLNFVIFYSRDSASSADESSCMETFPSKSKQPSSDHTYFRQKSLSGTTPPAESEAMETENAGEQKTVNNGAVAEKIYASTPIKSVTTLELHSEEQKTEVDVTMAVMDSFGLPVVESTPQRETNTLKSDVIVTKADKESANLQKLKQSPFSISSILGEKVNESKETSRVDVRGSGEGLTVGGEAKKTVDATEEKEVEPNIAEKAEVESGATGDSRTTSGEQAQVDKLDKLDSSSADTEKEVKSILSHIETLIEEEMNEKSLDRACQDNSEKSDGKDIFEEVKGDKEYLDSKLDEQQRNAADPALKGICHRFLCQTFI